MKSGFVWLATFVLGMALVSCSDPNGDYEKALAKEKQLVAYLEANFPTYEQIEFQGVGTTHYYVPLIEGTGDYPEFDKDYISITYRTWKMENYTTWAPNDADLLNSSDSAESAQKVVLRNYLHGGPELYPVTQNFPEFGLALSKMKKGGKIRLYIAPSVGTYDYTRVMEISLVDILCDEDFDSIQHQMMEGYRETKGIPEDELLTKHLITTSSSAITIGSEDGESYLVLDPYAGEGDVYYWVEEPGTGDLIANGNIINISSLTYGYLQRGRHVSNLDLVDYISLGHNLSYPQHKVGEGYKLFGDALDEILKGQRKGVRLHIFALSKFAFGWAGKIVNPANESDPNAFSSFMVPPGVPVVFDVTVGF